MRDASVETESLDDLFAFAAERGHKLTHAQIRRYQQAGVIPKPKPIGLGRGRGTKGVYRVGTAQRLAAACEALARNRSLRAARWRLWWAGYRIDPEHITRVLKISLRPSTKRDRQLPRQMRRRLRGGQLERFLKLGLDMQAGAFSGFPETTDERLFARGLGLPMKVVAEM